MERPQVTAVSAAHRWHHSVCGYTHTHRETDRQTDEHKKQRIFIK